MNKIISYEIKASEGKRFDLNSVVASINIGCNKVDETEETPFCCELDNVSVVRKVLSGLEPDTEYTLQIIMNKQHGGAVDYVTVRTEKESGE